MLQLYFLSVFCDLAAGLTLIMGERNAQTVRVPLLVEPYRFVLGIVTVIVGLLVLISPVDGDVPIAGDLVPALAAIASGLTLIYDYFHNEAPEGAEGAETTHIVALLLTVHRKTIGFLGIIAGTLHFLLPKVMFI